VRIDVAFTPAEAVSAHVGMTVVAGFDVGASPPEFAESPNARAVILSTTNGPATILSAAADSTLVRDCSGRTERADVRPARARGGRRVCAQVDVLATVPHFGRMVGSAAEIVS
jgi:hypothetical protein